ncbi:MAG: hypothetical protein K0A98_09270 [Trueperaceae bacterium]|nr:hypothetical protein [Trueperaceae bacterium]
MAKWLPWLLWAGLAVVVVGGVVAWWGQRQAALVAARLLTRAASEMGAMPQVPSWPLDEPAALRPDGESFPFDPDRPTLVVLLHGMTPSLELDDTVGTHAYARRYWGFHFVTQLLGGQPPRLEDAEPFDGATWLSEAPADDDPRHGLLLPAAADIDRAVFVVTRDGSRGLGEQVTATAAQVEAGVERFRRVLAAADQDASEGDREPQLVLIAHSFGGLVGRYLLTNPPIDGGPFGTDEATRARVDTIRDRTLYLVTLATPHEGSAAADRAVLLAAVDALLRDELGRPDAFTRRWLTPLLDAGATLLRLEDPVTEHLRTDVWAALNDPDGGLLAAHRARRNDGSPVPVYALAARSPGGQFFVDPMVSDRIELELAAWYAERLDLAPAFYREFLFQMLLADPTIHALGIPGRGWGRAADHPAPDEVLDRVTRVPTAPERIVFGPQDARVAIELAARVDFLRGPHAGEVETRGWLGRLWCTFVRCAEAPGVIDTGSVADVDLSGIEEPTVAVVRDLLLGREPPGDTPPIGQPEGRVGDGEIDADGAVPVHSALGYLLGADDGPYLAAGREWTVGDETLPGSWYRPDLADLDAELPWTYLHHIDLQWAPEVAGWLATELLDTAGPDPRGAHVSGWR